MPYLILAILTCILAPPLVGYAIKNLREERADLHDADPDFCGWYDTGPDLPAETHSARPGDCRGGSPTTAAAAFVSSSFHAEPISAEVQQRVG